MFTAPTPSRFTILQHKIIDGRHIVLINQIMCKIKGTSTRISLLVSLQLSEWRKPAGILAAATCGSKLLSATPHSPPPTTFLGGSNLHPQSPLIVRRPLQGTCSDFFPYHNFCRRQETLSNY